MLSSLCILLLYTTQGAVQGLVFGVLPLPLRQNPSATDVDQSIFSFVGYPFTFKFFLAPLIDGLYSTRIGRRESWLIPLQFLSGALLGRMAADMGDMLGASPPDVYTLTIALFVLVTATAAGDIATDAWAAGKMTDNKASLCQILGLTIGAEASSTIFFLLLGKELVSLEGLLLSIASLCFVTLGYFVISGLANGNGQPADGEDDNVGVRDAVWQIWNLVRRSANVRCWLLFLLMQPLASGHQSLMSVRYQAAGFSPELFSQYDTFLLPLSFLVMFLSYKVAKTERLFTATLWTTLVQVIFGVVQLVHFQKGKAVGGTAVDDVVLRLSYVVLKQLNGALDTLTFVMKVTIFNRIAQKHPPTAGTVITFMASMSNLGSTLFTTLAPLMAHATCTFATCFFFLVAGVVVVAAFWRRLRAIEDQGDNGW
mmetsp:Transcript_88258/g.175375  ORF Transcript_88258/g.175375 Transcript_88258/m.175375 type:complete len:426 (-) Transcript_88258:113-1390(-)